MNAALLSAIGSDADAKFFDAFGLLDDVVANPNAFGLSNVTDACAQFISCDPRNTSSGMEYTRRRRWTRSSATPS
jgi:phospholipase/lecithinase/hemolysin